MALNLKSWKDRKGKPRRKLLSVRPLPTLVTLGNLFCGFGAIILAMRVHHPPEGWTPDACLAWAGRLIFIAMIFDVVDGSVARWAKATSRFGLEMDSLCDVVSFGVAPAVLVWSSLEFTAQYSELPVPGRFIWLMLGMYVACAALRLGRYNVEATSGHTSIFFGMPSPAAAGCATSLVVMITPGIAQMTGHPVDLDSLPFGIVSLRSGDLVLYVLKAMPFVLVGLGILMVSRVQYVHVGGRLLVRRRSFMHLLALGLGLVLVVLQHEVMLVVLFNGYLVLGLLSDLWRMLSKKPEVQQGEERIDASAESKANALEDNSSANELERGTA